QLMEWAELDFMIVTKETNESFPEELTIEEIPIYIAKNKVLALYADNTLDHFDRDVVVIGADTIVVANGLIMGKPNSRDEAKFMLSQLSGSKHQVITGVFIKSEKKEISFQETTEVEFHQLDEFDIDHYIDHYKPFDKAGAYGIQEWIGVIGIKGVVGDFYNVMGLPISRVVQSLETHF
ncbi:MAG: Maf family protein, partial [Chitinophagaceae bacterium]